MSKEEVLAEFEIDIKNGANSYKIGECTVEDIEKRARKLIIKDRQGVIEALHYWLSLRHEGLTLIAVELVGDLVIPELKPDLIILRKEIASGKIYLPYYNEWVDKALKKIS